ncbi:MAG: NAD-dependent epimerase/dehydratase family protein [Candidatus Krumholzibacteriia bacterium]
MTNVLVTGGTGFTGRALVERLLDLGHRVTALDRKEGIGTQELRDRGATVVIGSVTDRSLLRSCLEGVEVVHHLAAAFRELNVPASHYDEVNVGGTRAVLEEAVRAGVQRFVYCSTCGVHGNVTDPPADENAPIAPADYYQRTKYLAEPVVLEFHRQGLPSVILRPAAIYGPGDPERFWMIFKRVKKGVFPMFGDGKTLYHPLYVDNLVDALVLVMEPGRGDGEAYLIADEEYVEIESLVRRVAAAMETEVKIPHLPTWPVVAAGHVCETVCKPLGVAPPIFPRRVDWFRQNRAFDIGKARRELGYEPRVGLDEGLRRTARWYRAEGYL